MKHRILTIILLTFLIFSCKNEKSTQTLQTSTQKVVGDDVFRVKFKFNLKLKDNFCLYFTNNNHSEYTEKNAIWMPVKGGDADQEITFLLPESLVPTFFRVDFGYDKNIAQSDIELKSFEMSYNGKSFKASGVEILDYFSPFELATINVPNTSILKRKNKDQVGGPILYPKLKLQEKIKEIASEESQD